MRKYLTSSLIALMILAAIGGVFWWEQSYDADAAIDAGGIDAGMDGVATSTGNIYYSNQAYHFSLWQPSNLEVTTYGGKGSELTVAFQDPTTNQGFEVFVTPYDQSRITPERFKLDEPSGVMSEPTDTTVDGVRGTMFYGNSSTIGQTREIWFINKGLLYEVTTYKPLDSWLSQIMQTWKFI